jgi:hypothetical protein
VGSVNFTTEQKSLILGTLLGDGCLEKRYANTRLRIDHAVAQKDYVFWKYSILGAFATQPPHELHDRDNRTDEVFCRWYFATSVMPELNFYYQSFYQDRKKVIREDIKQYFDQPLSLAAWLMDDGYKRNDCDALRISTDCFSHEEHIILQECLDSNFGIQSTLHRKGNALNIYIPTTQMKRVRAMLDPYIIPSMKYKLPPRNDLARDKVAAG